MHLTVRTPAFEARKPSGKDTPRQPPPVRVGGEAPSADSLSRMTVADSVFEPVTRADLDAAVANLRADVERMHGDTRADIGELRGEVRAMRWTVTLVGAGVAAVMLLLRLLAGA